MAVRVKRERTVSFRLSEQEYEGFLRVFNASGARSFSDFVRELLVGEKLKADPTEAIHELTRSVDRLSGLVLQATKPEEH